MKRQFVAALVHLYPRAWREEYGQEFADVLASRPLTCAEVWNVLANALSNKCGRGSRGFWWGGR